MAKYRKKPVVIDAVQIKESDQIAVITPWISDAFKVGRIIKADSGFSIFTLEGIMHAAPGDWIIRGVNGELYSCKPDIFAKTYEPAYQGKEAQRMTDTAERGKDTP